MTEKRRHLKLILLNNTQIDSLRGYHERLPALRSASIQPGQELPNPGLVLTNYLLDLMVLASELKLVAELRYTIVHEILRRDVLI